MNLVIVQHAYVDVRITCVKCELVYHVNCDEVPVYADLDGKPWIDYYCAHCAADMRYTDKDGNILYRKAETPVL